MKRLLGLLLTLALLLAGCSSQPASQPDASELPEETQSVSTEGKPVSEPVTGTLFAMDTVMDFTIYGDERLLEQAETLVTDLERLLSVTDEDSEIYALDHNGSGSVSEDTAQLLTEALGLCQRTDGALDLSIYPVVRAWGFTTGSYQVPEEETIAELLSLVDYTGIDFDEETSTVTLPEGMEIDLGAVAKGYTGDRVCELLRENGVTSALLNLGGNVQTVGSKPDGSPWRIAVQDPSGEEYLGVLEIENQAVITSGGYERYFEQDGVTYWHIIDPSTGSPARSGLISVTIVGAQGVVCDGLSTALFVLGLEDAAALWRQSNDFEAIFVSEDGSLTITQGLEDVFTPMGTYAEQEVTVLTRD